MKEFFVHAYREPLVVLLLLGLFGRVGMSQPYLQAATTDGSVEHSLGAIVDSLVEIDALVDKAIAADQIPGAVVTIGHREAIVWNRSTRSWSCPKKKSISSSSDGRAVCCMIRALSMRFNPRVFCDLGFSFWGGPMDPGVVFNIQRFSIHDGPGIRTTVFLKGCPLQCPWCHNPESQDAKPVIGFLPDRCIGCEACLETCPEKIAEPLDWNPQGRGDLSRCTICGTCTETCPAGARKWIGDTYTVDELMAQVDKDRVFYEESGGGVTFSGGEPTTPSRNSGFLLACLEACEEQGYHRTVDTSGFTPRKIMMSVAARTDLFLYDLKHMDDRLHRQHVGVSNQPILENLKAISDYGSEVWIRIPLIPSVNDDRSNLDATAAFVAGLSKTYPVFLLPYHNTGSDKHRRLGTSNLMQEISPPTQEQTETAAERFRLLGLDVTIGGSR
ncbi:glycyl-radical enzyme activating protein [Novipirellula artificiosorum]|uniref:glycyl-radical enzyme activating protein n=1 Tax=Novipirellula artificiosorum TaxID=2528016 RepID=UPI0018CE4D25|nr:glycyl-radical enzyme activating protein [Novipirellula artificiosorum]